MPKITDVLQIKGMQLRNRIVMAPVATGLAVDNCITDAHIRWYAEPAGAAALIVVEASCVDANACILPNQIGVWDDRFIPGLKRLADSIHSNGAKTLIQLVHGGARSWRESGDTAERLAPSAVVCLLPGPVPGEMTEAGIWTVIDSFKASASRAKQAGFDGIEIHGAHYYLLSQFLSPLTNRRTDAWGKDIEGRARILTETVGAIRNEVGKDFIISCRVHAVEFFEGGMPAEDSIRIVKLLEEAGVDLIDASGVGSGTWETADGQKYLQTTSVPSATLEPGLYVPFVAKLKAACDLPVAAVGRLAESGVADKVMEQGIDLVAIARQIIADPQTPRKLLEGRQSDINLCRQCLNCFKTIRSGGIRCPVNVAWN